jgi:hypothetical protein
MGHHRSGTQREGGLNVKNPGRWTPGFLTLEIFLTLKAGGRNVKRRLTLRPQIFNDKKAQVYYEILTLLFT